MLKKLSVKKNTIKNIFIVFIAMLVIPVMAFAVTTAENPLDQYDDQNRDIKITSDEHGMDGATKASPIITSDGRLGLDGSTSATSDPQNQGSQSGPDAVSSATGVSGGNGDDSDYEDDDEDDQDHNAIKDEDDNEDDEEDDEDEDDD